MRTRPFVSLLVALVLTGPSGAQQATFNRLTDTIEVPGDTLISTEITIEARILLLAPPAGPVHTIFDEQLSAKEDKILHIGNDRHMGNAWRGNQSNPSLSANVTWPLCQWVHLAYVSEGNQERLYRDGVLVASRSITGTIQNDPGSNMAVGAYPQPTGSWRPSFQGAIDWLRVSSEARYCGPVAAVPTLDPPPDGTTVLLYYFAEAPGASQVTDYGPNGWHGTLGTGFASATAPALGSLPPSAETYCTSGTSASGCQAAIWAIGLPSATLPSGFLLMASEVEGGKDGLFFYGANGRQAKPWGNGTSFQCVVPPVKRGGLLQGKGTSGTCGGSHEQDLNERWCPTCPLSSHNPGAGAIVQAQLWYRDPGNTSNVSTGLADALEFVVCP